MSEKKGVENVGIPAGVISTEEEDKTKNALLMTEIAALLREEREQDTEKLVKVVREMRGKGGEEGESKPARPIPSAYENAQHRGVTQTWNPKSALYRRIPEDERHVRNPDADHWYAHWVRSRVKNDHAGKLLAEAKLDELFPGSRAALDEGLSAGTGAFATGAGEFLPRPLEQVVQINRDRVSKIRRFATIYEMTAQEHNIPTYAAMTASMQSEGTTHTNGEGAVSQVALVAHKAQCVATLTKELLFDSAFNLVNVFAARAGGALGVLEDDQVFKFGTGTAPNITALTGTAFAEAASGTITPADIASCYMVPPQQYRDNCVWFISTNVLSLMSSVRDSNGRLVYESLFERPGMLGDDAGQVGLLMRRPVYEVPFSTGKIWFGDPAAAYAFGSRQGITLDVSEHAEFFQDRIVYKFTQRIAGNNVDNGHAQFIQAITAATI